MHSDNLLFQYLFTNLLSVRISHLITQYKKREGFSYDKRVSLLCVVVVYAMIVYVCVRDQKEEQDGRHAIDREKEGHIPKFHVSCCARPDDRIEKSIDHNTGI